LLKIDPSTIFFSCTQQDFKEYHTDTTVHFVITMTGEQMAAAEKEGIEKKFKLATSISTTNMVCFDQEGRIKKVWLHNFRIPSLESISTCVLCVFVFVLFLFCWLFLITVHWP